MKTLIHARCAVLAFVAMAVCPMYAGNVCTWTGAAGDGLVSTAANWDVAPVSGNGDTLMLSGAPTIYNDIADLSVGKVQFGGSVRMSFAGERLILTETTESWANTCPVVCSAPVTFDCADTGANKQRFAADVTFDNSVSVMGGKSTNYFRVGPDKTTTAQVVFNGKVYSEFVSIDVDAAAYAPVLFNGPVEARRVYLSYQSYAKGEMHLRGKIDSSTFGLSYGTAVCDAEDIFCPTSTITWVRYEKGGVLDLNGFNQRCVCLLGEYLFEDRAPSDADRDRSMTSATPATLTLSPRSEVTTYAQINGQVSINYAPTTKRTQTFAKRVHGTSGGIRVANGTVKMDDGTVWTNLKSLDIGATGAVTVADTNGSANPFPALEELHVVEGGKFNLPAGVAVTVAEALCNGAVVTAGKTYSGVAAEGVEQVSWIEGAGTVTVSGRANETRWIGPATGGAWGTAANWTDGVPSGSKVARFLSEAGDCAVVIAATDELPSKLRIDNYDGLTTVSVAGRTAAWNPDSVQVNRGGKLVLDEGTAITVDGAASFAIDGGEVELAGDAFTVQNFTGSFKVGGSPVVGTGTLRLTSGTFQYGVASDNNAYRLEVGSYGELKATGGKVVTKSPQNYVQNIRLTGGSLAYENATLEGVTDRWEHRIVGQGEYRFTGSSELKASRAQDILYVSPNAAGGTAKVVFRDTAKASGEAFGSVYVGETKDGTGILDLGSKANHVQMGARLLVGSQDSKGELLVSDGFVAVARLGLLVGGAAEAVSPARLGGRGSFKMSGGVLSVGGQYLNSDAVYFTGFVIGDGTQADVDGSWLYEGHAEISGGSVTNRNGPVIIGGPRAVGRMTMSGGTFFDLSAAAGAPAYFCVGVGGGSGALSLSGGAMSVASRVFVGGCLPASMYNGSLLVAAGHFPVDAHHAVGSLELSGGAFSCAKNLFVGQDGRGKLSVVGSTADIAIGGDLILSNTVLSAACKTSSEMAFALDADGVSPLRIAGKMVNTAGTKLTVDLGTWEGKSCKLAEFAAYEGPALTAVFTGANANRAKLVSRSTCLEVKTQCGLAIVVR